MFNYNASRPVNALAMAQRAAYAAEEAAYQAGSLAAREWAEQEWENSPARRAESAKFWIAIAAERDRDYARMHGL